MGVTAPPTGRRTLGRHVAAASTVAALVLGACSSTVRDLDAAEVLGRAEQPTVAVVAIEPSPVPTSTATPAATPTPLPTPTPVPEPLIPTDLIRLAIDDNFAALDELGARYTYSVFVDGVGFIEQRRPVLELRPASNQKVITAFGALELLPVDFRFHTEMRLDGQRRLHVVAGGDPTLTRADVEAMVAQVAAHLATLPPPSDGGRGSVDPLTPDVDTEPDPDAEPPPPSEPVLEITDLVVDVSYFDGTRTGPGWPERYVPVDVGPMSALMIDNNQHRADDAFLADPDRGNAELIAELLEDAGVTITGDVRLGTARPRAEVVATHQSPSLRTLVSVILSASDNEIADALVRQIARDRVGTSSILDGKQVIHDHLAGLGIDLGPVAGDGSGLSRHNRLSSTELVEVLLLSRERPWWPTMENGLANAGVTGTLRERLEVETTIGNVRAKTGTLVDVAALSGYLTTVDGGSVTFSLIIEAAERDEARDALDQIVVALASATLPQLTED